MLTPDTDLLTHGADPDSHYHESARSFFLETDQSEEEFVLCELVSVWLHMQLRNASIFAKPYTAKEAALHCLTLKYNPAWRCIDYDPMVAQKLWPWATETKAGFRQITDTRIAFTLIHHGATRLATANVKHF